MKLPYQAPLAAVLSALFLSPVLLGQGTPDRGAPEYIPTTTRPLDTPTDLPAEWTLPTRIDHDRLHWDRTPDGEHWVHGADYKASFGAKGFQFIPFLGSHVPRNFPIQMRLEGLQLGGQSVSLSDEPSLRKQDARMSFDRGAVKEIYDVALGGIEQKFLIEEPKENSAIQLHIAFSSELQAEPHGMGWRFQNEYGGVDYSGAVAINQAGQREKLITTLDQGFLRIEVPATFVQASRGPIWVDPLLSTFLVDHYVGYDLRFPDTAYDYPNDRYCVVYCEVFSGADWDVYTRVIDGLSGVSLALGTYVDMTTEFWIVPRVAFQLYDSKFMVVGQTLANASAYNSIKARTRNSTSASMGTTLSVDAGTSAFECFSPEIAGDVFPASSSYFVLVWHRRYSTDGDIWYAVYRADGTPHLAATPLAQDVNRNLTRPKISSSTGLGGNSGQLQAAWSNNPLGPPGTGPGAIEVRRIRYDGVLLGSTFTATAVSIPHYSLDVSEVVQATDSMSGSNYYVVTYDTFAPTRSTGLVLCSGDQTHDEIILNDVENSVPTQTDRPVLGATADSWILATARKVGSQNQIWNSIFQPSNGTLSMSEPPFMVYSVAYQSLMNELSVASTVSGGAPATWTGALVVASHDNGAENEIKGAFVYAASDPAVGSQYCVGEPNSTGVGALILASGDNSATTLKELQTVFMPAHQFCYMLSGTMAGFVDNPGGSDGDLCLGGAIGRYNLPGEFGNSGATGTYTFSLDPMRIRTNTGDVTGMVGSTWYFQTWFRDTPAGSGHSNFSNGVALTLD